MIGRETIARVREQTSITDLVGETVKLQKRGRSFVGLCPFHRELAPSFHVNPEHGRYHCFGCGESGDVFGFVQQSEGISHTEAVRWLAERAGIPIDDSPEERIARQRRQALYDVNATAATFFERMLREHPLASHASGELRRRGLEAHQPTDAVADALQAFRIGYAPYGWDSLVGHLRDAGLSLEAAESVGLIAPRPSGAGHYDRFRHRLMFAVVDLRGRVIAFSGRALPEPTEADLHEADAAPMDRNRPSETVAKYINSPESPIYHKSEAVFGLHQGRSAIRECQECILVEGNFDVVSLHARGIKQVVAPLGTAFTFEQARLLKRFAPAVTFMFDADSAGRRAVRAARDACREAGLVARVATLPEGSDPDDLIRAEGPDAIARLTRLARGLLEHLIDETLEQGREADDVQTKAAKIHEVASLLASENDPALRARTKQYAGQVAERLGIADAATFREVSATVRKALMQSPQADEPGRAQPGNPGEQDGQNARLEHIEHEMFGAALDCPELLEDPRAESAWTALGPVTEGAVNALRQSLDSQNGIDLEQLLAKLPPPIHPFAAARLAAPRYEAHDEARTKLLDNAGKLRRLQLRCSSSEVEELQRAAASGDFGQEIALLREHERRARKRHGL